MDILIEIENLRNRFAEVAIKENGEVVKGNTVIIVSGINKELVGEVTAKIRSLKKPEPYKGKGIRYFDEFVKIKPGKSAKK